MHQSNASEPMANSHETAIGVAALSKRFRLYRNPIGRIADLIRPRAGRFEEIWSLRDVTFSVRRGECFGIVGQNGSGKSTLLKLVTGTLLPTSGSIQVNGRVLALLELGGGINPELTGRQNVIMSAALLGFPEGYAEAKMSEIEEFAELGEFFDRPMAIYSSGMYVRLAFSIYLFMDPEVFIVDEALSVGDVFFQQKCYEALKKIMKAGTTVLFVSHDTGAIQKLCDRALLLDHGRIEFIGLPDEVVNRYHTKLGRLTQERRERNDNVEPPPPNAMAAGVVEGNLLRQAPFAASDVGLSLLGAQLADSDGHATTVQEVAGTISVRALVEATRDVANPNFSLALFDRFGALVFRTSLARLGAAPPPMTAGQRLLSSFDLTCRLAVGQYTFSIGLGQTGGLSEEDYPHSPMMGPLFVTSDRSTSLFYGQVGLATSIASASPRSGDVP